MVEKRPSRPTPTKTRVNYGSPSSNRNIVTEEARKAIADLSVQDYEIGMNVSVDGKIGTVTAIDPQKKSLMIRFSARPGKTQLWYSVRVVKPVP